MPTSPKPKTPKKTPLNQPTLFTETMLRSMDSLSLMRPSDVVLPWLRPQLSRRVWRAALVLLWAAAALAVGMAVGQQIQPQIAAPLPGAPVATANVGVSRHASASNLIEVTAGQFRTLGLTAYQPSLGVGALQPGYISAGLPQGTIGTAPVAHSSGR